MTDALACKSGMRFLTPDVLDEITIKTIEDEENYLPLSNVFVGMCTCKTLRKLLNGGIIADAQYNLMLKAAQDFYKDSLKYVLKKMDTSEGFWKHAVWIDFFHRNKANWEVISLKCIRMCFLFLRGNMSNCLKSLLIVKQSVKLKFALMKQS